MISTLLAMTALAAPAPRKSLKRALPKDRVENLFRVNNERLPPEAKIFLVAGSALASSFAREIVEQKKIWLGAGFKESEIACYYIVPYQEDFNDEPAEFRALAPELTHCYPANVKLLREHLGLAGSRKPPFLYLYVTSHGEQPATETLRTAKPTDDDYWELKRETKLPMYERHRIMIEGLPDGPASAGEILGAWRAGMPADELYLTPEPLANLLNERFKDVPKFVVLQGCFTGGFVPALSLLHGTTIITAARRDRTSFGCDPGPYMTFFGEAYDAELRRAARDPREMNWSALFDGVSRRVSTLERLQKVKPASEPQFVTTK
jgi:hypothetical protein